MSPFCMLSRIPGGVLRRMHLSTYNGRFSEHCISYPSVRSLVQTSKLLKHHMASASGKTSDPSRPAFWRRKPATGSRACPRTVRRTCRSPHRRGLAWQRKSRPFVTWTGLRGYRPFWRQTTHSTTGDDPRLSCDTVPYRILSFMILSTVLV